MWRAFDETGRLAYPDFVETVAAADADVLGARRSAARSTSPASLICALQHPDDLARAARRRYEVPVHEAPPLPRDVTRAEPRRGHAARRASALRLDASPRADWHRALGAAAAAVHRAGRGRGGRRVAVRDHPDVPHPSRTCRRSRRCKPYTPLELAGRDIYIARGLLQLPLADGAAVLRTRPSATASTRKPGEFVYDHPFQWGSRRIGPDLAREGGKYPDLWHVRHFENPRAIVAAVDHAGVPAPADRRRSTSTAIQARVDAMAMLGVPYGEARRRRRRRWRATQAAARSRASSRRRAARRASRTRRSSRSIAYLQRLGHATSRRRRPPASRRRQPDAAALAGRR